MSDEVPQSEALTPEQKREAGMSGYIKRLKAELMRMRRQEQFWRDARFQMYDTLRHTERERAKLDQVTWNIAYDSPNKTADYIKDYIGKARKGLGLDQ